MTAAPVKVLLYKWAGAWGPFKVNIPCGECALTTDVIQDTFETELAGIPVELETREWLSEWWKPLPRGAGMRRSLWSKARSSARVMPSTGAS